MHRGRAIALFALTVTLTVAALWRPRLSGHTPCMSKNLLGISCPGCGMTRSVTSAAHGDLRAAFRYHAVGPFVLAAAIVTWVLLAASLVAGKDYVPDITSPPATAAIVGLFVVLFVYWLIRLVTGTTP